MPRAKRDLFNEGEDDDDSELDTELDEFDPQPQPERQPWSVRLMANGEPQPSFILRNMREMGGICPRQMFVENEQPITLRDLAMTWGVPYSRIAAWNTDQNWEQQRTRYMQNQLEKMWEASRTTLAEMRGKALERATRGYQDIQTLISQMALAGKKPKYVNGQMEWVDFDPKDVGNLAKAHEVCVRGELATLGLNFKVQQDALDNPDDQALAPVQMMVFNYPANEGEQQRLLALPREAIQQMTQMPADVVEGTVVPVETGEKTP